MIKNLKINIDPPKNITHYKRYTSDIFEITEDKLRLKLNRLKKSIENKTSIFCYIGIIIAIIIALLTNNFKNFIVDAVLWKAIFIVALAVTVFFFIKNFIFFLRDNIDIDKVINNIKKEQK